MPTTVNGIGTHYYGKQNVEKRFGQCAHCGAETELVSYDTRLCFCVIFIPLTPLGKKRVLDECPSCRRHQVAKHGDWEELRGKAIRDATAEFEADPNNPEKAIAMHATLASAGEQAAAKQLVDTLASRFADNAEMQVYLGNSMEELGEVEKSNERFHQAFAADPKNPLSQHASAVALLREGRPDDARRRFDEFESSGEHRVDPSLLFALANEFKKQSDHQASAELLQRVGEAAPQAKRDKAFRRLAKEVEQAIGAEPGSLATQPSLWEKPAFWWSLGAAALLAAVVAYDRYTAGHQKLYVVNGLPQPITAVIDGDQRVSVPAGSWRLLTTSTGTHTARVLEPEALAAQANFLVDPSFLSRWFSKPATVLDPTRSAILLYEETTYSDPPIDREEPYELMIGELARTFDNADYHFAEFPRELSTKQDMVRKSRIDLPGIGPDLLALTFPNDADTPKLLDCAEAHLIGGEVTESLLSTYTGALWRQQQIQRGVEFLRRGLKNTPVQIEWHRTYHGLRELTGAEGLAEEYDALLAESPNDPDLLYLRARLEDYADRSAPLYEKALTADPKNVSALIGKAYSDFAVGRFDEALRLIDRALTIAPDHHRAISLRRQLLPALGRRDELEAELRKAVQEPPFDFSATDLLMMSAAARGDLDTARATQRDFAAKVTQAWPDDPHQMVAMTRAKLHRLEKDIAAANQAVAGLTDPETRTAMQWENALAAGDVEQAMRLTDQLPGVGRADGWLWSCLVATTAGDARADACRRKAIEAYRTLGGSLGEIGRLLAADLPADQLAQRVMQLEERPAEKATLLLLTAPRVGPQGQELTRLAEKLIAATNKRQPVLIAAFAAQGAGN